ncbi:hypothetical protein [Streptacidiphilus jiangxiensis]|uniref:Uncharacterized protein n=1 Tax=Streptacidiphilus jiangxiensis TaxID=235985 RepID=A0A1H7WTY5_STRJI|nr:hypothetical protein [Streptacidiphilus jiangxiensis]SEM25060.1 hypothetical protein SAMN05414137_121154 [Streptacidiphilus jiangxiensis]
MSDTSGRPQAGDGSEQAGGHEHEEQRDGRKFDIRIGSVSIGVGVWLGVLILLVGGAGAGIAISDAAAPSLDFSKTVGVWQYDAQVNSPSETGTITLTIRIDADRTFTAAAQATMVGDPAANGTISQSGECSGSVEVSGDHLVFHATGGAACSGETAKLVRNDTMLELGHPLIATDSSGTTRETIDLVRGH